MYDLSSFMKLVILSDCSKLIARVSITRAIKVRRELFHFRLVKIAQDAPIYV